jgi:hypothetical protein
MIGELNVAFRPDEWRPITNAIPGVDYAYGADDLVVAIVMVNDHFAKTDGWRAVQQELLEWRAKYCTASNPPDLHLILAIPDVAHEQTLGMGDIINDRKICRKIILPLYTRQISETGAVPILPGERNDNRAWQARSLAEALMTDYAPCHVTLSAHDALIPPPLLVDEPLSSALAVEINDDFIDALVADPTILAEPQ